ncbi:unnamed protein product [Mesocestoides corti]|uniref:Helicase C-terminal domain-containing protein n=1 Tax=Mesocestoides corti TaxID=53468 RepID=A0A0R3UCT7_MESCO|nr:unnamed protein product [Mesocestoides corti]
MITWSFSIKFTVAARGLDFPYVKAVINFGLPLGLDEYVHRIGRTGRMGHTGLAITLVASSNIKGDKHLQSVARGVCRLIGDTSGIPKELQHAARLKPGVCDSDEEYSSASYQRQGLVSPCPPQRLKSRYPKNGAPVFRRRT